MTYSPIPINFTFIAKIQSESDTWLKISEGTNYSYRIPPQTPKILRFRFENTVSIVRLVLTSNDDKCMIIAAEHRSCPTSTTSENKIETGSLTQRMRKNGTLLLEKSNFRDGELFIVLETQPSNESCFDNHKYNAKDPWQVNETINFNFYTLNDLNSIAKNVNIKLFSISEVRFLPDWLFVLLFSFLMPAVLTCLIFGAFSTLRRSKSATSERVITSNTSHEHNSMQRDKQKESQILELNKVKLSNSFSNIFRECIAMFWPLILQSSWYFLGVYQLLVLSRAYIHRLGDSHFCFVDYVCAKPNVLLNIHLSSFNNVFSNLPYIMLGISYIFLVIIRKIYLKRKQNTFLFVSLGVAMIMEGFLSAMYHICPSNDKFQFDITFIYTLFLLHIVLVLHCNTPNTSLMIDYKLTNTRSIYSYAKAKWSFIWSKEFLIQTIFSLILILCWIVMLSTNHENCLNVCLNFSMIVTVIVAGFVGVGITIKSIWTKKHKGIKYVYRLVL